MVDVEAFSQAHKLMWTKHLLDPNYSGFGNIWENTVLTKFDDNDSQLLWKISAPECVSNSLKNCQLAETIRVWYLYRE